MPRRTRLLIAALFVIGVVTLTPMPGPNEVELLPFSDIGPALTHPIQLFGVIGNVLLFLPLGVALHLRGRRLRSAVLTSCLLSVSIELAQLAIPGRTTSFDDALTNTCGAALGWLLANAVASRTEAEADRASRST